MVNALSSRLGEALRARNMTRKELINETGLSENTIGGYFQGTGNPVADKLVTLSKVLKVSIDWLLGLTNNPEVLPDAKKTKPKEKTVIVSSDMTEEELEKFASTYTGLSIDAVRALHNSRSFQIEWRKEE